MTACRHSIAHGILQEKTHIEYFYKEALRKIREVVNILHLYHSICLMSCVILFLFESAKFRYSSVWFPFESYRRE